MTPRTVTLKEGANWCELAPLLGKAGGDLARIVSGTFGIYGDVLEKPAQTTWEEAAFPVAPGLTALTPFDLELVLDAVTGFAYFPEGGLEEILALGDQAAEVEALALAEDELTRFLAFEMSRGTRRNVAGLRRRRADSVA